MRILHIVTLLTPDNAYGGPMRVALNQVRGLQDAGHQVDLIAGHSGFRSVPSNVDGIPIAAFRASRLVPYTGFAGLCSPEMLLHLTRHVDDYDIVHIHLARDLITLPAAEVVRRKGIPYVLQTHGMVDESQKKLALWLDSALTKRIISEAKSVFYLTPEEKKSINSLFPGSKQQALPNGVPTTGEVTRADNRAELEVLYMARLQERKRPLSFVKAARDLLRTSTSASFRLVGPDEGEAAKVNEYINEYSLQESVRWEGPVGVADSLSRMNQADIYVLPSIQEPFPMSVLEAMSLGLPVVITESNGLAPILQTHNAGLVVSEEQAALSKGIGLLLENKDLRTRLGKNARDLIVREYSITSVVATLSEHYKAALTESGCVRSQIRKASR
ncbi:glycosyltransferase [Arthrobacter sp. MAHUQ-56]